MTPASVDFDRKRDASHDVSGPHLMPVLCKPTKNATPVPSKAVTGSACWSKLPVNGNRLLVQLTPPFEEAARPRRKRLTAGSNSMYPPTRIVELTGFRATVTSTWFKVPVMRTSVLAVECVPTTVLIGEGNHANTNSKQTLLNAPVIPCTATEEWPERIGNPYRRYILYDSLENRWLSSTSKSV